MPYFVAKTNANFPNNMKLSALPAIQGIIVVCNAENGQLLALMDSIEITDYTNLSRDSRCSKNG